MQSLEVLTNQKGVYLDSFLMEICCIMFFLYVSIFVKAAIFYNKIKRKYELSWMNARLKEKDAWKGYGENE